MPFDILKMLPQDYAADVYHKVRLEAGTVHLAKYLIRVAVYILVAKVFKISDMQHLVIKFYLCQVFCKQKG